MKTKLSIISVSLLLVFSILVDAKQIRRWGADDLNHDKAWYASIEACALARVIHATGNEKYITALTRGLDCIFAELYPRGGWPQFRPLPGDNYYSRITFNDGAMIRVLNHLSGVASGGEPLVFVDAERRYKSANAVKQGIDCILKSQIKQKGNRTVWCAQHDKTTFEPADPAIQKPRIIVTSDGEIDDQCSMIRFLLYTNECDVEGIVSSSSQYHAHGHNWAGDDWIDPDLDAYAKVYPNLIKHDPEYPTPQYLRERTVLGNVESEGDMEEATAGSQLIVKVLLDETDDRPVWLQAWGGMNTIARALKTIEDEHPERMAEAAKKMRFFFIWEQDKTYQEYIRPHWGKYEIPTIISDQFEAIAYRWKQAQPKEMHKYFEGAWMKQNILENHGPLCSIYAALDNGDFRSEGDSPAFLHTIVTGLRNMESPDWGGWGGRYVRVRENTWLDPVPVSGYAYPSGRWYGSTGWGRNSLRTSTTSTPEQRREYFKPMWRWTDALQNDFAARADWCVKSYEEANHAPVVVLGHAADMEAKPGAAIKLSAQGTSDPDGDELTYRWWQYQEAGTYNGTVEILNAEKMNASFTVPNDADNSETIHIICEVKDNGSPQLTRYQRVVIAINTPVQKPGFTLNSDGEVEIPRMTAHFPLDGGNGNLVTEAVSGLKGSLNNADPAVSWVSGKIKGAVHLDGRDDRIIFPHNAAFDFGNEAFSISFWMRWPKGLPAGHEHILTKGDYESSFTGETGKRWEIFVSGHDTMCFTVDDDVVASMIQVSLEPFITGEWVHVAAIRDIAKKQLRLYANGVLLPPTNPEKSSIDGIDRTGNISNPQRLTIGDAYLCDNPFAGDMDDIQIYLGALTDQQISDIASLAVQTAASSAVTPAVKSFQKPRVIVTSDGEIDDECSMIRFLLYANEWDIEGIVTSSSQYHWQGHKWAGDDWIEPSLDAYAQVYPNLLKHDARYPAPEYLRKRTLLGNVKAEGEMEEITAGSQHIVKVLLDESDDRPIWLQAWGGTNTIARALKTIEVEHPEKMAYVANKIRFFFIWEQDATYQTYIRPHWGKYNILTIISDQFIALFYHWKKYLPPEKQEFLVGSWMKQHILQNHGPLCALYKAHENGDFRSEGDSPSFLHNIVTGLRNMESPDWGGWGGRYTKVRENTWLDPVADPTFRYPGGRWYTGSAWGRSRLKEEIKNDKELTQYLKPIWRWIDVMQNDFAARADWCVKSYKDANHAPIVMLGHAVDLEAKPGAAIKLSAEGTSDPDGDKLTYRWWQYGEADSFDGAVEIMDAGKQNASFAVPNNARKGKTIHIICEVTDNGTLPLTRYQRVVVKIK